MQQNPNIIKTPIGYLNGEWKCIGGDTTFSELLNLTYSESLYTGLFDADQYKLSYNVFGSKIFNVPELFNKDTILISNRERSKRVLFKRNK